MNTTVIKLSTIAAIAIFFSSCGTKESNETTAEHHQETAATTSSSTPSPINPLVQHYIHLKNALVSDNLQEAKAGAKGIIDAVNSIDTTSFSPEQKNIWKKEIAIVKENAQHVTEAPEVSHQREHLGPLSSAMHNLIQTFGGGKTLYYDFCPMANDNKGGYWLSETEEIKNPYFGDEMLSCGQVKETLK